MAFKELLRLLRFPNLVIVFFTQVLIWCCVLWPAHKILGIPLHLSFPHLLILSLSTVLIAAAGYIINDYFDVKIDAINRPEKSLIGKEINPKFAIILHSICNLLGILLGLYLAVKFKIIGAIFVQLITTLLLWRYSTHFKRQFLIGNVVVALMTAMTILILLIYEPNLYPFISDWYFTEKKGMAIVNPFWVLLVYAFFAFMLTWIREVVKDMEDFKGDAEDGCRTMPIQLGLKKTTHFVMVLAGVTVLVLGLASHFLIRNNWLFFAIYILTSLCAPILYFIWQINANRSQHHYARLSALLKLIMVLGIGTLIIYYFLQ